MLKNGEDGRSASARRMPALRADAWPRRALVRTTSIPIPGAPGASAARVSSDATWASEAPLSTITSWVPSGEWSASASTARARSSGQSVASSTTEATPTGASSSREGTDALDP